MNFKLLKPSLRVILRNEKLYREVLGITEIYGKQAVLDTKFFLNSTRTDVLEIIELE
jgi:hypothetical protein